MSQRDNTTGKSRYANNDGKLYNRSISKVPSTSDEVDDIIDRTNKLKLNSANNSKYKDLFVQRINPLILTALSAFLRMYRLDLSNFVVWDEAHFGKFGSYYLKNEIYFDVHPPLGKLLVGLSGYLAGYDGNFSFESGETFPDNCNYVFMRCFNCIFGVLCTPIAYKTALELGFSQWSVWLISLMVIFEMLSLTLSKFILLDSMLLFFTVLSYYCLVKIHNFRVRNELLTTKGLICLFFTGLSIGCVCSVKWVGLFVTLLIGLYIVYDLLIKTYQVLSTDTLSYTKYALHWVSRIVTLIIVPFALYATCFKIHFAILNHSGPGDGSISTLLQASLKDNDILDGPRSVAFGSLVTLRSQGLSPNLLHSHNHLYPEGSQQQQITTYGFKDDNNDFLIEFDLESGNKGHFATQEPEENNTYPLNKLVTDGDTIRLVHKNTGCLLHSHAIQSFILKSSYEVSCYANLDESDSKDEWVIEIQNQEVSPSEEFDSENPNEIHPINTNFRLRHKVLGCYLATSGYSYPAWGFQQGEVMCKYSYLKKDKTTWWNVEAHINDQLPIPESPYVPPKPKFWKEFLLLNYGMMASNNALVPDPDKFDKLASLWWEWPILHTGLRMCSWGANNARYFLLGNPAVNWISTFCVAIFVIYTFVVAIRWQRQIIKAGVFDANFNEFLIQGISPFVGWILHYAPFIMMGRVTYLHHYIPALYFAIFITGFMMENLIQKRTNKYVSIVVYISLYLAVFGAFFYLKDLSLGMVGPRKNYSHLKLLQSWMI